MSDASDYIQPPRKPKNDRKRGFRKGHAGYVTRMHSRAVQESGESFERVAKVTPGGLIENSRCRRPMWRGKDIEAETPCV